MIHSGKGQQVLQKINKKFVLASRTTCIP